jgi:Ring finger domain
MSRTTLLPCEFCGALVSPQLYTQHAYRCQMITRRENESYDEDMYHDEESEDSILLRSYITRDHQVHGTNMRDFLCVHGSSPPISSNGSSLSGTSPSYFVRGMENRQNNNIEQHNSILSETSTIPYVSISDVAVHITGTTQLPSSAIESHEVCPICQQELYEVLENKTDTVRRFMKCLHCFCHRCISTWIVDKQRRTCPVCMTQVVFTPT